MTHHTSLNFLGVDIEIEYYYQPAEKPVMYYSDGSGYPGCSEEFEIIKIKHKGEDITDLCEVHFQKIEEQLRDDAEKERDDY